MTTPQYTTHPTTPQTPLQFVCPGRVDTDTAAGIPSLPAGVNRPRSPQPRVGPLSFARARPGNDPRPGSCVTHSGYSRAGVPREADRPRTCTPAPAIPLCRTAPIPLPGGAALCATARNGQRQGKPSRPPLPLPHCSRRAALSFFACPWGDGILGPMGISPPSPTWSRGFSDREGSAGDEAQAACGRAGHPLQSWRVYNASRTTRLPSTQQNCAGGYDPRDGRSYFRDSNGGHDDV